MCRGGCCMDSRRGFISHIYIFRKLLPFPRKKNMVRLLQPFIRGKTTCASNFRGGGLFLSPDRKLSHDDFSRFLDMAVKMRSFVNQRVLSKKLENAWWYQGPACSLFVREKFAKMFRRQKKRKAGKVHIFDGKNIFVPLRLLLHHDRKADIFVFLKSEIIFSHVPLKQLFCLTFLSQPILATSENPPRSLFFSPPLLNAGKWRQLRKLGEGKGGEGGSLIPLFCLAEGGPLP